MGMKAQRQARHECEAAAASDPENPRNNVRVQAVRAIGFLKRGEKVEMTSKPQTPKKGT
jgi:hypothetical protein